MFWHRNNIDDDYDENVKYYYDDEIGHPLLKRIFRFCVSFVISILILIVSLIGIFYFKYKPVLNRTPPLAWSKLQSPLNANRIIKASDGTILWESSSIKRHYVMSRDLNHNFNLKKALLSIEDRDFYHESGVNYFGIVRAAFQDLLHRNQMQGGSTITQQLIKLSYFSTARNDRTINRKLQEMQLALNANNQLPKNQILAAYMNKVYLSQGVYGMASASEFYMHRPFQKLSIAQAALLAGMVQSPSAYDPYLHPKWALARRNTVLKAMFENHQISKSQLHINLDIPLHKIVIPQRWHNQVNQRILQRSLITADFIQRAKSQMPNQQTANQVITTSLNWPLQQWIVKQIKANHFDLPNKKLQFGITVMDNRSGQILSQIGNRTFNHLDGYNRAVQSNRSTGSVIKPILDYGPAMDQLHWGSNHIVYDSPFDYPHTHIQVHDWDGQYLGRMTIKKALYLSRNVPAIKTFLSVGANKIHQYAKQIGITHSLTPSNAIGVNASSEQMASAFSALAQQGVMVKPRYINQIYTNHQISKPQSLYGSLFSKQTAYMLTKSLENVPTTGQSGYAAQIKGFTQAGKTGTIAYDNALHMPKNAISDAWYVGYTPQITVSIWTGYDNPNQKHYILKNDDNKISELMYKKIILKMRSMHLLKNESFAKPSGIQEMMDNSWGWTKSRGSFVSSPLVHQ